MGGVVAHSGVNKKFTQSLLGNPDEKRPLSMQGGLMLKK
jgi:hypothetical protein